MRLRVGEPPACVGRASRKDELMEQAAPCRGAPGMAGQVSKCGGPTKRVKAGEVPAGCCVSGVTIAGERLVGGIVGETPTFLLRPDLAGDTPR